ncbi:MAG: tetratricopeptide repeat protein [candidate division Zixibacteria bacterium]|nr:tetratricopeptide repeat protein [candidate division Zixibacteria bacterium]
MNDHRVFKIRKLTLLNLGDNMRSKITRNPDSFRSNSISNYRRYLGRYLAIVFALTLVSPTGAFGQDSATLDLDSATVDTASLPNEEKAKLHFNKAQEISSSPAREAEMVSEYKECLKLDPTFVSAHINLGVHYFGKEKYADAEKHFKSASELNPEDTTALSNLGKTYYELRKFKEAIHAFEGALDGDPAYVGGHKELGKIYYKQKKYKDALESLDEYHLSVSDDHYSHWLAGKSYHKLKKNSKAIAEFKKSIRVKKKYAPTHKSLGVIYYAQGDFAKAVKAYRNAVKYNSKDYRSYYNLAIAIQANDPEDLTANIAAWKRALKMAKKHPRGKSIVTTAQSQIEKLEKQKANEGLQ